jgi:hypothetical protein
MAVTELDEHTFDDVSTMSTVRSGIEELRYEDVGSSPDAAIEESLGELLAVADAVEAEVLRRVAAVDGRRSFERDGFLSTVSWLVARFRMSRSKAAEVVRVARPSRCRRCRRLMMSASSRDPDYGSWRRPMRPTPRRSRAPRKSF